jgi:hypothetical protein
VLRERELAHGDELKFGRARCRFVTGETPLQTSPGFGET